MRMGAGFTQPYFGESQQMYRPAATGTQQSFMPYRPANGGWGQPMPQGNQTQSGRPSFSQEQMNAFTSFPAQASVGILGTDGAYTATVGQPSLGGNQGAGSIGGGYAASFPPAYPSGPQPSSDPAAMTWSTGIKPGGLFSGLRQGFQSQPSGATCPTCGKPR